MILKKGFIGFYFKIAISDSDSDDESNSDSIGGVESDCSKSFLTYVLDTTNPDTPQISLQTESPGGDPTPVVRVSGVSAGDLVKVYRDATCTANVIGSSRAHTSTIYTDITLSELVQGNYFFYAHAVDVAGNVSNCSEVSGEYVLSTDQ